MTIANEQELKHVPKSAETSYRINALAMIRFLMGGLMCSIGLLHIIDPWHFLISIKSYQLIPTNAAVVIATLIPLIQMLMGFQLLFDGWVRSAYSILALMLGAFTLAEISAVLRDLDIQCGCLGRFSPTISWYTISLTFALFVACVVGMIWARD